MLLAVTSCLSLAVSASAANTVNRKATDFRDFDHTAWYAEAVSAAVDNGLLYGKSSSIIDPNGDMTRAEMAAIINRSFGCYAKADISKYKDVSKDKWYFEDVAMAVQMGTYNGRSNSSMAPDAPITRQEAMTVVARALELDYDSYSKAELTQFSDAGKVSNWAMPYVRAMVGADYIHGRGKILAPLDNITRAEFAQIFHNIIGTYIVSKGTYDKDIKGSVLIRTDEVTLQNMTVDGDLIIGCGAADGKITHSEMEFVRRFLRTNFGEDAVAEGEQILLNLFEQRKRMEATNPYAFQNTIRECGAQIAANMSYEERLQLLSFLAQIARSDGNVCAAEIDALKEVAQSMQLSAKEVESMLNLSGNSLEEAYKVLEVEPTATDDEVRAAYRRLALKHHPDRVATLGEDIRKAAEEKFQSINNAKERIYKARGMK